MGKTADFTRSFENRQPTAEAGSIGPDAHADAEQLPWMIGNLLEENSRTTFGPLDQFPGGRHPANLFILEVSAAHHIVDSANARGTPHVLVIGPRPRETMIAVD